MKTQSRFAAFSKYTKAYTHKNPSFVTVVRAVVKYVFCSDGARGAERGVNTKKKKERETNNVI